MPIQQSLVVLIPFMPSNCCEPSASTGHCQQRGCVFFAVTAGMKRKTSNDEEKDEDENSTTSTMPRKRPRTEAATTTTTTILHPFQALPRDLVLYILSFTRCSLQHVHWAILQQPSAAESIMRQFLFGYDAHMCKQ